MDAFLHENEARHVRSSKMSEIIPCSTRRDNNMKQQKTSNCVDCVVTKSYFCNSLIILVRLTYAHICEGEDLAQTIASKYFLNPSFSFYIPRFRLQWRSCSIVHWCPHLQIRESPAVTRHFAQVPTIGADIPRETQLLFNYSEQTASIFRTFAASCYLVEVLDIVNLR